MDKTIRPRLLGRIIDKLVDRPHYEYYKKCVAHNDILCFKCDVGIEENETAVSKPTGYKFEGYLHYYHQDCHQRLYH